MGKNLIAKEGERNGLLVTDTTAQTGGNWSIIRCLEITVFSVLTGTITLGAGSALADAQFRAGAVIYGNFTAFTLASGAVVAYTAQ
jgi:hypothetical protein